MRIFLDANVLFSATKSDGAVRRLQDLLIEAGHECWADGFVAEEARRNLAAKFPDGLPVLETLLSRLHTGPIHTPDSALEDGLPLPETDRPVLVAALDRRSAVRRCAPGPEGAATAANTIRSRCTAGQAPYSREKNRRAVPQV